MHDTFKAYPGCLLASNKMFYYAVFCQDIDDAFIVVDLGDIVQKWKLWKSQLPRVEPYYGEY